MRTYVPALKKNQLTIIVAPAVDAGGARLPDHFDAFLADHVLVAGTRQPFLDGARKLIKIGFDPDAIISMRHAGADYDALRARIGHAARLTVKSGGNGAPMFALEQAVGGAGGPPVRKSALPVVAAWEAGYGN